jgi:hypothetical protein
MPNLPWPDRTICQLAIMGSAGGNSIVNVLHFQASPVLQAAISTDAAAQLAVGTLVDDWWTNMAASWRGCHPDAYTVNMLRGQILERTGFFRRRFTPVERIYTTNNQGTSGGAVNNYTVSGVVRWRTALAGKRFRGRTYIGPLTVVQVSAGRLSASGAAEINTFADAHVDRYGTGGVPPDLWIQTIYSKPYNKFEYQYTQRGPTGLVIVSPDDYAGNAEDVTTYAVDSILRSQRRREVGVGA